MTKEQIKNLKVGDEIIDDEGDKYIITGIRDNGYTADYYKGVYAPEEFDCEFLGYNDTPNYSVILTYNDLARRFD